MFIKVLIVLYFFCGPIAFAQSINEYTLITEEFPPINYEENGKLKGIAIDLLDLMLKKMNSKLTINDVKLMPWARGYKLVQEKKHTVLFGMTRRPARENLFKWVGPIASSRNAIFARKDRNIKINSVEDLKQYRIGVVGKAVGELILLKAGVPQKCIERLFGTDASIRCAKMLNVGRFDLWSYDEITASWILKTLGYKTEFEVVYLFPGSKDMYYAFHKSTPDSLIQKCQKVIDKIKQPSTKGKSMYNKILEKYIIVRR